ncbi:MAG: helix-turn-helix domain-containing protein [Hyphomonadaceae bacterium]
MVSLLARRADDAALAALAGSVAAFALRVPEQSVLTAKRGGSRPAFARQVAMYLCHTGFELSLSRIAAAFGRDRSTVAHACHLIEDRREEPQFDLWIGALEAMLHAAPHETLRRSVQL